MAVSRLTLARQAYLVALRAARVQSTPHTWARLLRAAHNLREARGDERSAVARGSRTPRD